MLLVDCAACLHRPPNIRQSPECGGRTSFVWKGHPPYLGTRKKNPVGIQAQKSCRQFPRGQAGPWGGCCGEQRTSGGAVVGVASGWIIPPTLYAGGLIIPPSLYAGGLIIPPLRVKGGCGCFPRASHTSGESAFLGRTIFVC